MARSKNAAANTQFNHPPTKTLGPKPCVPRRFHCPWQELLILAAKGQDGGEFRVEGSLGWLSGRQCANDTMRPESQQYGYYVIRGRLGAEAFGRQDLAFDVAAVALCEEDSQT